ncbi:uncharacterized protein LOC119720280 [Patiria miniata]|uniref:Uncharacterized protein n=1 Tax=Patiria miniata TaxID=46514 RepID=A0A913Z528_PATMI|nr:uncharacterized protein LOC119720280 [Patiria miniata]
MNLRDCALQWTDIEHIASAVHNMHKLTDLILSNNPALGESTEKWSRYSLRVKKKHTLDLSSLSLTWKDVGTISIVLDHIPALTDLTLADNWGLGVSAELWAKELPRMTHLNKLDLTFCRLTPSDIKHIASAVLDMPRLTDLTLGNNWLFTRSDELWAKELPNKTHLIRLDLTRCYLTSSDIKHIASALHDMPRRTELILSSNWGLGGAAKLWAKELPKMTHLIRLDLTSCNLMPSDIQHIASAVLAMPRLTDLTLGDNQELSRSSELWVKELPKMTHLNRLDLSSCRLTLWDIKRINSPVLDMPRLLHLILSGNWRLNNLKQPTGTIANIGLVSGSNIPTIVGATGVNFTIINYQMEGQEPPLDDRTLREVAKRLGCAWVALAVELDFTMVQVQTIERNHQNDITRQGLDMLVTWKQAQSTSDEQQRTTLCTALEKIGRADIVGFLQGVPAPRPQQSQRPDQEPRVGDPYQETGNKTRDILKRVYTTTGSYVQLLPGVDNDKMHIPGIYTKVQLETREGVAVVTGQKGETVNSTEYAKIFRLRTLRTKTEELIKRLIFFGMGGVGKSTIFDKIAYDWADETSEILKRFKLVFLLKMCALSQESDLVDSTFDQLLGEKSGIEKDELDKFILANPNEVLILLDGFDEMKTKKLDAALFGSILKALNRTVYQECFICVSSRPSRLETLMSETLVQNPCTHVEVLGFTDEDVHEYVKKFFDKDPDSRNALIQTIEKSNTQRGFATNPLFLLLMCLLWRENKQLPETTSRLFNAAVDHMFTRKRISGEDVSKTVISIGQTALLGLMSANQKFSFQEDEFEPRALDLALKAGILTKQRVIKNCKSHNNIQFTHKTMQEYFAAKYLQSVHRTNQGFVMRWVYTVVPLGEFTYNLRQLCQTIEGVVSNEFLFRFCCGDNEKCMTDIVNLLDSKFNKYEPKYQSDVVQAISRNCFFESQSSKAPRCLTSDSHIPSTIDAHNTNDFRSLMYLLEIICKSESRMAQLARVETIEVSSVSSVSDLAFVLGYMENLRNLRLYSCPLVNGDLEKTLLSLKCLPLIDLCIKGGNTLGGRAKEWAPHIKHFTSLNRLEISDCNLQITDIEHIASAATDIPNLTDLNLAGNTALGKSVELWANHLSRFTNIQTLNLSNCTLQWTDIEHIASAVGDMPRLTDLILTDNPALGASTEKWSRYLLRVKQKHTLDLSNFSLTWEDVGTISVVLDSIPKLTNLILSGNTALGGSAEMWANHLTRFTNIKTLNLSNCTLRWTDIELIASAVGDMPSVTNLILTGNPALGVSTDKLSRYLVRVTQKHTLDLSNFSLTWEDVGTISVVLDSIPKLTNLILSGNTALGGSAEMWANHLTRFTNIKTLNLSNCTLRWTDIEHIAPAVGDMPRLTDLVLADNPALGAWTEKWSRYLLRVKQKHTLDLSNFSLTWEDVGTIFVVLDSIPKLTNLILSGNTSLGGSAELEAKRLSRLTNIKTLNLSNCTLQGTGIEHIASAAMPSLTNLILAGNTALGRSAKWWAKHVSRFTNIQTLNLSNCALQWTDIQRIASVVGDMPKLTDLILTGNPALGVSTEKWSRYLLRVKQKHTLDLRHFSLTLEDVDTISVVLDNIPALTNLILAGNTVLGGSTKLWVNNLSRLTNIQTLNLSNCTLRKTDIKHIASAVGDMSSLTNLILAGNTALGGSADMWIKSLLRIRNLTTLNLSSCTLQWTDIEDIASAVSNPYDLEDLFGFDSGEARLTDLILTDNPALGASTEKWSRCLLRVRKQHTLDLRKFLLTWKDVGAISILLDHFPEITKLILAGNTSLGGSAEMWSKNLFEFTNIKTLDLNHCSLTPTDIECIAATACVMPNLTDLALSDNNSFHGLDELQSHFPSLKIH